VGTPLLPATQVADLRGDAAVLAASPLLLPPLRGQKNYPLTLVGSESSAVETKSEDPKNSPLISELTSQTDDVALRSKPLRSHSPISPVPIAPLRERVPINSFPLGELFQR